MTTDYRFDHQHQRWTRRSENTPHERTLAALRRLVSAIQVAHPRVEEMTPELFAAEEAALAVLESDGSRAGKRQ